MRRNLQILLAGAVLVVSGIALAAPEAPAVLRATQGDHSFQVVVLPGQPSPGETVTLQLDLNQIPKVIDPTFGDRIPVREASLVAVLTPVDAPEAATRHAMHGMGGAGRYGFHWTPGRKGVYTLTFQRRDGELPEAAFRLGVGVEVAEAAGARAAAPAGLPLGGLTRRAESADRARVGVAGPLTPATGAPTAAGIMHAMAEPALALDGALRDGATDEELARLVQQLEREAARLKGTVPAAYRVGEADYDRLAGELQARLATLSQAVQKTEAAAGADPAKVWQDTLGGTCAQCHVKFWWAITPDLAAWPKVEANSWKR